MSRTRIGSSSLAHDLHFHHQFKVDIEGTTGLTLAYQAGREKPSGTEIAAGTVALTDNTTNYVMLDGGAITAATSISLTADKVLYEIVTASGNVSTITDRRGDFG